jgi:hypothetical protein
MYSSYFATLGTGIFTTLLNIDSYYIMQRAISVGKDPVCSCTKSKIVVMMESMASLLLFPTEHLCSRISLLIFFLLIAFAQESKSYDLPADFWAVECTFRGR